MRPQVNHLPSTKRNAQQVSLFENLDRKALSS
jgi:hypothetical protein